MTAVSYCGATKLPTQAQLEALRNGVGGNVRLVHGWPGNAYYRSSTAVGAGHVDVDTAATNVPAEDFGDFVTCLQ